MGDDNDENREHSTTAKDKQTDKINKDKMLQIMECLNINNLIYKFMDV